MEDRRRDVALFRYSLIREAADASLTSAERGELVRHLALIEHVRPDGTYVAVGRSTLDRWIRAWSRGGFEALMPAVRARIARTDATVLELAEALKREAPDRTAAQVRRVMSAAGTKAVPSERTLQRHFARLGLNLRPAGGPPRAFGRYQASRPNELWAGDGMHGPVVAGRKAILVAFIDDYSRCLTGYRFGPAEDTVRLEAALRAGLSSRGVPEAVVVDRGSAFVSAPFHRACAVLGVRVIHARPRSPQTKGKIERVFETIRSQFLVELATRTVSDLAELNRLFSAWVEVSYHRSVHHETKTTPLAAFGEVEAGRFPSPERLREAFLWSETRTVTKTATVSLHGNLYEVDPALVGRRAELVFDPFDLERIEVRFEGRAMGLAVAHKVTRHTHPKARPDAAPPPVPTGIDYLGLLVARRDAELAEPISYAGLTGGENGEPVDRDDEDDEDDEDEDDEDKEEIK